MNSDELSFAFDELNQDDLTVIAPGKRGISEEMWSAYLSTISDSKLLEVAKEVKKKTLYADWDTFTAMLHESFNDFKSAVSADSNIKIVLPSKFSSEHILVGLLWKEIKELKFAGFITCETKAEDGDVVLMIDDAMYSGHHAMHALDMISFSNHKNTSFEFHAVIPYTSKMAKEQLINDVMTQAKKVVVHSRVEMDVIEVPEELALNPEYMFGILHLTPLYFDHKVAGSCSTFTSIYLFGIPSFGMILPIKPDTDIKQRVYDEYFEDITKPPTFGNHIFGVHEDEDMF